MAKLRNLKLSKIAFQVDFSAKHVQRFSFRLLVAPKLKKQGGRMRIMPNPPGTLLSFWVKVSIKDSISWFFKCDQNPFLLGCFYVYWCIFVNFCGHTYNSNLQNLLKWISNNLSYKAIMMRYFFLTFSHDYFWWTLLDAMAPT